jgi:hypothetical protein
MVWLAVYALAHRWPLRVALWRVAAVLPMIVGAAIWYPRLAALGFTSSTVWATPPLQRLSPGWLVDATLGGIYGPAEALLVALLALWVVAGFWQHRHALRASVDADLLCTGLLLLALGLALPDQYTNTIVFAERWLPAAAILIVLAAPAPTALASLQRPLAIAVVAIFSLATTLAWLRFERDELSGLSAALAALPDERRVIGLDLVQHSDIVKGRPFVQTAAYAQVLHGGRLGMSFAAHAPSLVVFSERRPAPWTPHLEWYAERVRIGDFDHFDYALINGRAEIHAQTSKFNLQPITHEGRWRLYRTASDSRQ